MANGGSAQRIDIGANFSGQAAFATLQQSMQGNVTAMGQFAQAMGHVNVNAGKFSQVMVGFNNTLTNTFTATGNFDQAIIKLSNTLGALTSALSNVTIGAGAFSQHVQGDGASLENYITINARATQATNRFFLSLESIARIAQAQVISRYTQALGQAFDDGVVAAANFDVKIAAIRTISQDAAISQEEWRQTVRRLSDEFGSPILDTVAGTYEAISNQVAKGAGAARFMADAMNFAKTTLSSTADAVNLLSSVINAYKLTSEDATRISATLFKVIDLGRTSASEMANILGPTAVTANLLGIRLEELGAATAILTSQGTHTNTALTLTSNLMQKLVKPTAEMKELFKQWGVASGEAAIATYGFGGVVEKLGEVVANGGVSELAQTLKDLRAIRAGAGLTTGNVLGDFKEVTRQIIDGTEAYAKAQAIIAESAGEKFKKEVNKIQNILTMDLGNSMLEFLVTLSGGAGSATEVVKGTTDSVYAMVAAMAGVLGAGVQVLTLFGTLNSIISTTIIVLGGAATAWRLYNLTMLATPWGRILQGIGLVLTAITTATAVSIDMQAKAKQAQIDALAEIKRANEDYHREKMEKLNAEIEKQRQNAREIVVLANQALAAIMLGWDNMVQSMTASSGGIEEQAKLIKGVLDGIKKVQDGAELANIDRILSHGLANSDTLRGITEIQDAISNLRLVAEQEFADGNFKLGGEAFTAFKDAIVKAQKDIEDTINNSLRRQEDAVSRFKNRTFDLKLESMTYNQKETAIKAEVEKLLAEAKAASAAGNTKEALSVLDRAQSLAEQLTNERDNSPAAKLKAKLTGTKPAADLTLEQAVLDARMEAEKNIRDNAQTKAEDLKKQEFELTLQVTQELRKQEERTNAINELLRVRIKLQEELSTANKVNEDLGNRRKQNETDRANLVDELAAQAAMLETPGNDFTVQEQLFVDQSMRARQAYGKVMKESSIALKEGTKDPETIRTELAWAEAWFQKKYAEMQNDAKAYLPEGKDLIKPEARERMAQERKTFGRLGAFAASTTELTSAEEQNALLQDQVKRTTELLKQYAKENFNEIFKQIGEEAAKPIESQAEKLRKLYMQLTLGVGIAFPGQTQVRPQGAPGFAQGGVVQGVQGFDNISIKAMAGEGIINREMTARYYPQIKAINQGTHSVNNANTYHLTFNVDGGKTSEDTIRDLGTKLKREIARGRLPGLS